MNSRIKLISKLGFLALAAQAAFGSGSSNTTPNDRYFSQQWALHNDGSPVQAIQIDADNYHTISQQGVSGVDIGWMDARDELASSATHPVIVAVIDSGLDAGHEDLAGRVAPGAMDFLTNFPIVTDPFGHGTHVSGIIAANVDNGIGIAGVAPPSVQVLPLRILWPSTDPKGNAFSYPDPVLTKDPKTPVYKLISNFAADAVNYAVQHGASVINISLEWPKIVDTDSARSAIQNAVQKGVLVVVAAGNDRKDQTTYPCAYEGVLCVGSITNTGQLALFSNRGGMVDILAPGDGIISTYSKQVESTVLRINGYEILSGTSQAAPYVAGIAAALKSTNPDMSLNELKARLLLSGSALPSDGASLYGLVNLKRALDVRPQPVYLPDFKSIDGIVVDEATLTAQGQISIQNLWQQATGVQVQALVNGKPAGSAKVDVLAGGDKITVPWTYQFGSLNDSSNLRLTVQISDALGTSKSFSLDAVAVRRMEKIQGNRSFAIPGVQATDWVISNNNHLLPNSLNAVESIPPEPGLPRYYKQLSYSPNGGVLQIYDPSSANPIQQISLPGLQGIREVIRMDVKGDGKMDWVVAGVGANPNDNMMHYEWYFLDPTFQPLFGTPEASNFQAYVQFNSTTGDASVGGLKVTRNYAAVGSWIRSGAMVLPAFLDSGAVPDKDNFGEINPRHYGVAEHLYYLSPTTSPDPKRPVQLELRVLDDFNFRTTYPKARLQNVIPESAADKKNQRIRILVSMGDNLTDQTVIWDIRSVTDTSILPAPGWNSMYAAGQPYVTLTPDSATNSSAFLGFDDTQRGSIDWVSADGQFLDRSEFQYKRPENPIVGLIGAFNIPSLGRFWFVESGFDLVAYHQASATGKSGIEMQTMPIERDSSFALYQFSQMFTPVMVGTSSNPMAGVYVDSTLVRGDQVSVAVWNPTSGIFERPLRYSLKIPEKCLQMNPVQLASDAESLGLPLICQQDASQASQLQFVVVQPQ